MKAKYPVEALALSMILFSTNMKEAFITGAIVLFAVTFAMFLNNLLIMRIPKWSGVCCVALLTATVCSSGLRMGFYFLNMELSWRNYLLTWVIGILAAKHVLQDEGTDSYGELFYEMAVGWAMFMLISLIREFVSFGSIAGNQLADMGFATESFQKEMFGYLAAGMGIAFTNGILKTSFDQSNAFAIAFTVAIAYPPITLKTYPQAAVVVAGVFVTIVCLYSIQKRIAFSDTGKAYAKIPVQMLSLGFLYMILSIF